MNGVTIKRRRLVDGNNRLGTIEVNEGYLHIGQIKNYMDERREKCIF
jgi:hypothetical protein